MKTTFAFLLCIGISGCTAITTTRTLGTLQEDYRAVLETEEACSKGSGFPEVCMGDFKAQYGSIEYQTETAIKQRTKLSEPGEQQITIALYRLAAFASLSADSGHAARIADEGLALCNNTNPAPPRDCALLTVLGQYEVVEQFARDVDCTIKGQCGEGRPSEESLVTGFCKKQYNNLASKTNKARSSFGTFLSRSVIDYMDDQIETTKDHGMRLAAHITKGIPFERKPADPCSCAQQGGSSDNEALDCGEFDENSASILMAYCINDSLANDSTCPEF
jgi:hypothetical protein